MSSRRRDVDEVYRLVVPGQPAISPDGTEIVYVLRTVDRDADRDVRALWRVAAAGGTPRQLTRGVADTAPAWSPDGTRLAFLRATDGPPQLCLLPAGGGEADRVTALPLGAGAPVWSPDGTAIAFLAPVDLAAQAGEDDVARARRAAAPIVADRLDYQADGAGLLRTIRMQVHVLDVAARAVRQVTSGDWHADDVVWSPDGTRLAFSAALAADADLTWQAGAYVVSATEPDAAPGPVGPTDGRFWPVDWTPDGRALLAVGRLDTRPGHAGLLLVLLDGGPVVDLAAGLDRNVMPGAGGYPGGVPRLIDGGRRALFCVRVGGDTHLYAVDVDGGAPACLLGGAARVVSGLSVAGATAAIVLGTATSFGEIATVDLRSGALAIRTAHGADDVEPFVREPREFTISDGTVVHGWLVRDRTAAGRRPLLLDVHGGPHNAWNGAADWEHVYHQVLAARGWAVLLVNPRGSDGYGETFYTAALGAWGVADAPDLLEPIDQLVAEGIADPERLAVAGYSYGGFMACYLTGHDRRFRAAVAGGVISDVPSMVGTSDGGHYIADREFGGADRFAVQNPLAAVDRVRTPTLILQGAEDRRCPVGQAQEWFAALRRRGVPTRLVLYPDASHLFVLDGRPSHRADWNRRTVAWLERYAGGGRPAIDRAHWRHRLAALAERHRVPGASLGILRLGEDPVLASHGVLSKATGVPVTDDTLFQIGSITKMYTATVAMRLVDDGRLDLDAPVVDMVPELRLADPEATKRVTLRHLLTHTSGIDGDVFTDTGRGDDCLERYVDRLTEAGQNHPVGATFSYCNSGFVLIGRMIEKVTGQTWDAALRELLFGPLGVRATVTLPEEAVLHRTAVGHVAEGGGDPEPTPVWALPRSSGPAGSIDATAADVLAFAAAHLRGGLGPDGARLLSDAAVTAMADRHVELPDRHTTGDSWGLGWMRFGWGGHRLIGHDGNTIGQSAFLRVLPAAGLVVTLLTNGGNANDLYADLFREIFAELAGIAMPPRPAPTTPVAGEVTPHVGVYERASTRLEVVEVDGVARLRETVTGPLAELTPTPTEEFDLVPIDDDRFAVRVPGTRTWRPVVFYALPSGQRYVHYRMRATPKVGGTR